MSNKEVQEDKVSDMTNEEYREKLINIFNNMQDNNKLRFWYRYISKIEEG